MMLLGIGLKSTKLRHRCGWKPIYYVSQNSSLLIHSNFTLFFGIFKYVLFLSNLRYYFNLRKSISYIEMKSQKVHNPHPLRQQTNDCFVGFAF